MSMPGGVASGMRGSSGAGAPGSDRRGSARSFGRPRAAARTRRALGVCALAASIPAFAAGAVPVGVALIVGAQVAFAAALLGRRGEPGIGDGVAEWMQRPPAATAAAPWPLPLRPPSLWRPPTGEWPGDAPGLEVSLN